MIILLLLLLQVIYLLCKSDSATGARAHAGFDCEAEEDEANKEQPVQRTGIVPLP